MTWADVGTQPPLIVADSECRAGAEPAVMDGTFFGGLCIHLRLPTPSLSESARGCCSPGSAGGLHINSHRASSLGYSPWSSCVGKWSVVKKKFINDLRKITCIYGILSRLFRIIELHNHRQITSHQSILEDCWIMIVLSWLFKY